jgi:NADH dehydrogenase FAD-containing subunit
MSEDDYEEFYRFKLALKAERAACAPKHLVILGAGFGGLEAYAEARRLLSEMPEQRRQSWKVTMIERRERWVGGWATQFIMTKRGTLEELSPLYSSCRYNILHDEILEVNLETRRVVCRDHGVISADFLVVALGFQAQATPLVENKMWNICDVSKAEKLGEALDQVKVSFFFFFLRAEDLES